ncbi:MAG: polysaccharide biosynthesis C-terminal domain-containing protein [Opitutales bacterium]|nr:polysaccharide biosynthesis C-terminal domain-containing protein [Opitutales bacterium]
MGNSSNFRLTRYQPGTFQELWAIFWPLMLSVMSGTLMVFTDRAILASYSSDAFNACATAQPWYWTLDAIFMAIIASSEIVLGRMNGAQHYQRMGPAVWQMLLLSFSSYLLLIPIIWNVPYLLADTTKTLGAPYLQMLLTTLPFELAGCGAIGSFFIAIGDTKKIPRVIITTCLLNGILDYWFVFGGLGIPSMGIVGAALGTNIANIFSFSMFLCFFLQKKRRQTYAIHTYRWSWDVLHQCTQIGLPNSITYGISNTGWCLICQFFALKLLPAQYKAYFVSFTIYNFMFCVTDSIGKATGTLCSNFIGAHQRPLLSCVMRQATRLISFFAIGFAVFCTLYSTPLIRFLGSKEFAANDVFIHQTKWFLVWYCGVFMGEALRFCVQGFLFALLKPKAILIAQTSLYWLLCLIPTYFLLTYGHNQDPAIYTQLLMTENLIVVIGFYLWYRKATWKQIPSTTT